MSIADVFEVAGDCLLIHAYSNDSGKFVFRVQRYCQPKTRSEWVQFKEASCQAKEKLVCALMRSQGWKRIEIEGAILVTPAEDNGMSIDDFCATVLVALGEPVSD